MRMSRPGAFPGDVSGHAEEERPDVQLIAIMGPTGSGKSSFINLLLSPDAQKAEVGHGLNSCTDSVEAIPFDIDGFRGSIIDTPGFDDTYLTDTEVLRRISVWMDTTYRQGHQKITGVLYLREITEAKMRGSSLKNLTMFRKLCGTSSLSNVVFLTTKWDLVPLPDAERREAELHSEHLQVELAGGARTARHNNTRESALEVLRMVLGNRGVTLQLQKQLVDEGMRLRDTDAGAAIAQDLDALQSEHVDTIRELGEQVESAAEMGDEGLKGALEKRLVKVEEMLARVQADKAMLEMDRHRDVLTYQRRLEEVAKATGQSSSGVVASGLLSGLVTATPMIFQEWQAWKSLRENRRAEEEELRQKRVEQELIAEKRQLEIQNEIAREKEVLALRKEAEGYRALNKIPLLDLLALPEVKTLLETN